MCSAGRGLVQRVLTFILGYFEYKEAPLCPTGRARIPDSIQSVVLIPVSYSSLGSSKTLMDKDLSYDLNR